MHSKVLYDLHRDVYPVQRDVVTTEPEPTRWLHLAPPLMYVPDQYAKVETVHKWTKQFTFTNEDSSSCECEAKFSTTVTSLILRQTGEKSGIRVADSSDAESDSD